MNKIKDLENKIKNEWIYYKEKNLKSKLTNDKLKFKFAMELEKEDTDLFHSIKKEHPNVAHDQIIQAVLSSY